MGAVETSPSNHLRPLQTRSVERRATSASLSGVVLKFIRGGRVTSGRAEGMCRDCKAASMWCSSAQLTRFASYNRINIGLTLTQDFSAGQSFGEAQGTAAIIARMRRLRLDVGNISTIRTYKLEESDARVDFSTFNRLTSSSHFPGSLFVAYGFSRFE